MHIEAGGSGGLASDGGFAVLAAAAIDGQPLAESGRVLIALAGRAENTGMGFSSDRRTVGNRWGAGPVRVETIAADVEWPWTHQAHLTALASSGVPTTSTAMIEAGSGGASILRLSPRHQTMWYLLTPDAIAAGNAGSDGREAYR